MQLLRWQLCSVSSGGKDLSIPQRTTISVGPSLSPYVTFDLLGSLAQAIAFKMR